MPKTNNSQRTYLKKSSSHKIKKKDNVINKSDLKPSRNNPRNPLIDDPKPKKNSGYAEDRPTRLNINKNRNLPKAKAK